jgi:hypothetical protein
MVLPYNLENTLQVEKGNKLTLFGRENVGLFQRSVVIEIPFCKRNDRIPA